MIKYCEQCGSKYELTEYSIIFRDKNSLDCDICGQELFHWNGGCIWTSKLLEKGNKAVLYENPTANNK